MQALPTLICALKARRSWPERVLITSVGNRYSSKPFTLRGGIFRRTGVLLNSDGASEGRTVLEEFVNPGRLLAAVAATKPIGPIGALRLSEQSRAFGRVLFKNEGDFSSLRDMSFKHLYMAAMSHISHARPCLASTILGVVNASRVRANFVIPNHLFNRLNIVRRRQASLGLLLLLLHATGCDHVGGTGIAPRMSRTHVALAFFLHIVAVTKPPSSWVAHRLPRFLQRAGLRCRFPLRSGRADATAILRYADEVFSYGLRYGLAAPVVAPVRRRELAQFVRTRASVLIGPHVVTCALPTCPGAACLQPATVSPWYVEIIEKMDGDFINVARLSRRARTLLRLLAEPTQSGGRAAIAAIDALAPNSFEVVERALSASTRGAALKAFGELLAVLRACTQAELAGLLAQVDPALRSLRAQFGDDDRAERRLCDRVLSESQLAKECARHPMHVAARLLELRQSGARAFVRMVLQTPGGWCEAFERYGSTFPELGASFFLRPAPDMAGVPMPPKGTLDHFLFILGSEMCVRETMGEGLAAGMPLSWKARVALGAIIQLCSGREAFRVSPGRRRTGRLIRFFDAAADGPNGPAAGIIAALRPFLVHLETDPGRVFVRALLQDFFNVFASPSGRPGAEPKREYVHTIALISDLARETAPAARLFRRFAGFISGKHALHPLDGAAGVLSAEDSLRLFWFSLFPDLFLVEAFAARASPELSGLLRALAAAPALQRVDNALELASHESAHGVFLSAREDLLFTLRFTKELLAEGVEVPPRAAAVLVPPALVALVLPALIPLAPARGVSSLLFTLVRAGSFSGRFGSLQRVAGVALKQAARALAESDPELSVGTSSLLVLAAVKLQAAGAETATQKVYKTKIGEVVSGMRHDATAIGELRRSLDQGDGALFGVPMEQLRDVYRTAVLGADIPAAIQSLRAHGALAGKAFEALEHALLCGDRPSSAEQALLDASGALLSGPDAPLPFETLRKQLTLSAKLLGSAGLVAAAEAVEALLSLGSCFETGNGSLCISFEQLQTVASGEFEQILIERMSVLGARKSLEVLQAVGPRGPSQAQRVLGFMFLEPAAVRTHPLEPKDALFAAERVIPRLGLDHCSALLDSIAEMPLNAPLSVESRAVLFLSLARAALGAATMRRVCVWIAWMSISAELHVFLHAHPKFGQSLFTSLAGGSEGLFLSNCVGMFASRADDVSTLKIISRVLSEFPRPDALLRNPAAQEALRRLPPSRLRDISLHYKFDVGSVHELLLQPPAHVAVRSCLNAIWSALKPATEDWDALGPLTSRLEHALKACAGSEAPRAPADTKQPVAPAGGSPEDSSSGEESGDGWDISESLSDTEATDEASAPAQASVDDEESEGWSELSKQSSSSAREDEPAPCEAEPSARGFVWDVISNALELCAQGDAAQAHRGRLVFLAAAAATALGRAHPEETAWGDLFQLIRAVSFARRHTLLPVALSDEALQVQLLAHLRGSPTSQVAEAVVDVVSLRFEPVHAQVVHVAPDDEAQLEYSEAFAQASELLPANLQKRTAPPRPAAARAAFVKPFMGASSILASDESLRSRRQVYSKILRAAWALGEAGLHVNLDGLLSPWARGPIFLAAFCWFPHADIVDSALESLRGLQLCRVVEGRKVLLITETHQHTLGADVVLALVKHTALRKELGTTRLGILLAELLARPHTEAQPELPEARARLLRGEPAAPVPGSPLVATPALAEYRPAGAAGDGRPVSNGEEARKFGKLFSRGAKALKFAAGQILKDPAADAE